MLTELLLEPEENGLRFLRAGATRYRCAIGKGGVSPGKREGDGATPVAVMALRRLWWRRDRIAHVHCALPMSEITPDLGWCDDPDHASYNRPVPLPFGASHEKMCRDDGLYDLVVELGWNDAPPKPGHGSAIFMHIARENHGPTEGCIALARNDLMALLSRVDANTLLIVRG